MALTRPNINNIQTNVVALSDSMVVLNSGSTTANLDIGLLLNRANGTVSNVAVYWSEAGQSFVTAFTTNAGDPNSNIVVTNYANLTTGGHTVYGNIIPGANVTYNLGSPTQRFSELYLSGNTIDLNGATISATNGTITFTNSQGGSFVVTGSAAGQVTGTFGNLVANSGVASTSTTTGALQVVGGAGITGNLNVGGNLTVAGTVTFTNTIVATTTESVSGVEVVAGNLVANSNTTSTSTTTGALVVLGGAGITGNLNVGGNISANNIFQDRGGDANDWNTLTTMGVYLINRSSWSGTTNTPINSQYFTGQLEVTNTGNVSITQNYRPYNSTASGDVYWTRSKYSTNAWSNWVEVINGAESVDGGSF